jgi:hypothetical protein
MSKLLTAETFRRYTQLLTRSGVPIGMDSGVGSTFRHPEYRNVVVRVVANNVANANWLKFCHAHQINNYLPRLFGVYKMRIEGMKSPYAVFMERLQPLPILLTDPRIKRLIPVEYTRIQDLNNPRFWRKVEQVTKDRQLAQVAHYLSICPDVLNMRDGTIMLRKNHLVFVDPVAVRLKPLPSRDL